jgi:hypothetical protein
MREPSGENIGQFFERASFVTALGWPFGSIWI